jgi:hypothetical protein
VYTVERLKHGHGLHPFLKRTSGNIMGSDRSQLLAVLVLVTLCTLPRPVPAASLEFEITVPEETKVKGQDAYICTTLALPDKPYKLVGVEPLGRKEVVHHILLFGEPLSSAAAQGCLKTALWMLFDPAGSAVGM